MILAFNIECGCPIGLRELSVSAGDYTTVEEFTSNYHLTHIECPRCHRYMRLVSYIDVEGVEHEIVSESVRPSPPAYRASARSRRVTIPYRRRRS